MSDVNRLKNRSYKNIYIGGIKYPTFSRTLDGAFRTPSGPKLFNELEGDRSEFPSAAPDHRSNLENNIQVYYLSLPTCLNIILMNIRTFINPTRFELRFHYSNSKPFYNWSFAYSIFLHNNIQNSVHTITQKKIILRALQLLNSNNWATIALLKFHHLKSIFLL